MTKIPIADSQLLVRDFGLLVNQAAVYGITHKIIRESALAFFSKLSQYIAQYQCVEFSILEEKISVNESSDGIDLMTSRNLKDKMLLHKLPGLVFLPEMTQNEFLTFLTYFAKPPVTVQELGGLEAVLTKEGVKGVLLTHFVYQRIDATVQQASPTPPPEISGPAPEKKRVHAAKSGRKEEENASTQKTIDPLPGLQAAARRQRNHVHAELISLLTEVAQLVSDDGVSQEEKVVETLRSIRDTLRQSTEDSKANIANLLGQHYPPEEAVAGHQKPHKKAGKLHLTPQEFAARFAELTQELAQPLTVTNGVIELLRKGQAGNINESQRGFLDLAIESVERVNQLIKYMHSISGEPESFLPDTKIIGETYV
jgi:hypothetical protein